jgi:cell division cycle protein 20 (cofactor of APC complex)
MEASYHLLVNNNNKENNHENVCNDPMSSSGQHDSIKRRLINETCNGLSVDTDKVLNMHSRTFDQRDMLLFNTPSSSSSSSTSGGSSSKKNNSIRNVTLSPEKILDAPDFRDDFYLNLIDWSSVNCLAVALNRDLYIWNATSKDIFQLFSLDDSTDDYITSVAWIQKGNILSVGTSKNTVELWDVQKRVCLRQMKSHSARVGALAWNSHVLSSGSRSGDIHNHDVRVAQHHIGSLKLHSQEVCGLKWNSDGRHLASGANDNLVGIWDWSSSSSSSSGIGDGSPPLHILREHTAAVKALAWCPWQTNILATGGGTLDRHIKIWNMYNGGLLQSHDVKSQVSSLLWNKNYRELMSSHGFAQNQLTIWKYPEMSRVCDLLGHSNRVLGMSASPDQETVVSVGSDETLRFWKCFALDEAFKRNRDAVLKGNANRFQSGLSRSIR